MSDHTQRAHAVLSASGSHRWMACPGSVRLEAQVPKEEVAESEHAALGTKAHEWGEALLQGKVVTQEVPEDVAEASVPYANYVKDLVASEPGSVLFIEHRFNLSWLYQGMFGTCDAVVVQPRACIMHVADLKSGSGVRVDAKENSQLMYYALGALNDYGFLFEIHTVRLHIVQPRINHFDTWDISAEELLAWGYNVLKKAAEVTAQEDAPLVSGDHCRWCTAKLHCPEVLAQAHRLAAEDFQDLSALTTAQLLELAEKVEPIIKAIYDRAKTELLSGLPVDGWKVVAGRSTRAWVNETSAARALPKSKFPDAWTKPELKSVAQVEKALKTYEAEVNLEALIVKKPGNPTLARESDKRPALSSASLAAEDFS